MVQFYTAAVLLLVIIMKLLMQHMSKSSLLHSTGSQSLSVSQVLNSTDHEGFRSLLLEPESVEDSNACWGSVCVISQGPCTTKQRAGIFVLYVSGHR